MVLIAPDVEGPGARADSKKQRIYRSLRADIIKGVFDMGEKLNEGQLAARYGVTKTPVREALGLLQQEGLVEAVPRVGYLTSRVTVREVDDIFELRVIVEGAAAEKAATAMTEESLRRLEQLHMDFHAGDRESYLKFLEENLKFHCTIAEASRNRLLAEVVAGLLERMHRLVILRLDLSSNLEELVGEHYRLLDALRQRDAVQARAHMVVDITNTHQMVLDSLKEHMANWHL